MLTLTPPHQPLPRAALEAPRGFAWWYVDLVDAAGNGLVFILASGLPFLPGPARRPSLNLAVYAGGAQVFYVLQELDADAAAFPADGGDDEIRVGQSRLRVHREGGRIALVADVDVDIPGVARARGTIAVDGVARVASTPEQTGLAGAVPGADDSVHAWSPQTGPCRGRAELVLDGERVTLEGRAYYDRNGSARPLHALGIDHWWWCRSAHEGAQGASERIAYVLWPTATGPSGGTSAAPLVLGLTVDARGATTCRQDLAVEVRRRRRTLYGMELFEHIAMHGPEGVFLDVKCDALVDSGPFYLRGLHARGVFEHVAPHRIDLPHHRPFVAQRVARSSSPELPFMLPLFFGHVSSRTRRTLSFWRQRWLA